MSLSSILNQAVTALSVNQQALRTTSTNIANVNTPGYVRQRVHQEPLVVDGMSAGVKIAEIERAADRFLEQASRTAKSDAAQFSALAGFHERLQALLGKPDENTSLPGRLDQLFASISELSLDPAAAGRRQSVVASLQSFGDEVSRLADQIQKLRSEASGQIQEVVGNINAALERIADLNPKIVQEKALGGDVGPLEEQRSQAIKELSELIDVQVRRNGDGSVRVSTSTGLALVDHAAFQLQYDAPGTVTAGTQFSPITVHKVNPNTGEVADDGTPLDAVVRSGKLRGLLDMRDKVLPDFAAELGEFSRQVMDQVNAVHNTNTAVPAPNTLTGRNTGMVGTDRHGFTGKTTFAVVAADGTRVNEVTIDFDSLGPSATLADVISAVNAGLGGDGTLSLSGGRMSLTATASDNGVAIVQDDAGPGTRSGRGFSHFFGMNDLLKSVAPSAYETGFQAGDAHGFTVGGTLNLDLRGPDNQIAVNDTMTVAGSTFNDILSDLNAAGGIGDYVTFSLDSNGALAATPKAGYENYKLFAVSDTTSRSGSGVSLTQMFGIGEAIRANAAQSVSVTDAIRQDNALLAAAKYDTSAAAGDPVITAGDGRGALALEEVQHKSLAFEAAGKLNTMNATLGEYGAAFLSNAGLAASQEDKRSSDAESLSVEVDQRLSNKTGVNLDEELSNMLMYQNAYNAAARIITTTREMMDTLLQIVR